MYCTIAINISEYSTDIKTPLHVLINCNSNTRFDIDYYLETNGSSASFVDRITLPHIIKYQLHLVMTMSTGITIDYRLSICVFGNTSLSIQYYLYQYCDRRRRLLSLSSLLTIMVSFVRAFHYHHCKPINNLVIILYF